MKKSSIQIDLFCELQNPGYIADVTDESFFDFTVAEFIDELNFN